MKQHISQQKLKDFVKGAAELTNQEQEHLHSCENCNDSFRDFVISNDDKPAKRAS